MTKALVRIPLKMAEQHKNSIAELIAGIKATTEIGDLHEARARAEALRAWAKVHGTVKTLRLDLLRVEVEALVRIVELGGTNTLPAADRKAAQWLANMSPLARTKLINDSGAATTARGMCQSVWREEEVRHHRQRCISIGQKLAEEPTPPPNAYDEDAIIAARDRANSISGALASIADSYVSKGVEFTIDEMAEEIIADAALPGGLAEDDAINKGIREVCREAVRRSPPLSINGTAIPRVITARTEDGKYIRIPVMNATVAHLDDMITMRKAQLEQDQAALRKLEEFAELVRRRPGGKSADAKLGALIAASLRSSGSGTEQAAS